MPFLDELNKWVGPGAYQNLFGLGESQDPTKAANKYIGQIPGQVMPYFKPYMEAGTGAIPTLQGQYSNLLNDPGGMVNKIGTGYKQSPGFDFALKQALAGSDRAAAAGGYSGMPQHSAESMEAAEGLASKDFNNYLQNALGQYGLGLQGEQGLFNAGQKSSSDVANMIAQMFAQQGNLAFAGASGQNDFWNNILKGGVAAAPYIASAL